MNKIPTLFVRDFSNDGKITRKVNPECQWVVDGEGIATQKYDGTCCMIRGGNLYRRYDCKRGRTPPPNFEPSQEPDSGTGHQPGWIPVGDGPEDKYHREAFSPGLPDGTYELCGPRVQGNPEGFTVHVLVAHATENTKFDCYVPRDYDGIASFLQDVPVEGIVWHHPDGRMAKIKAKDFGVGRASK